MCHRVARGLMQELLERISDGVLADDRRSAMSDLRVRVPPVPWMKAF